MKNLFIGVALSLVSMAVGAQQFTPSQKAISDYYIAGDIAAFKAGGSSIIARLVGSVYTTPKDIRKAYDDNEVAGDQAFFKKTLLVSGEIESINSGIGNEPYLTLKDGSEFSGTQAAFDKVDISRIASLKKGGKVQLVCTGGGVIVGTPMLRDCLFADDVAKQKASLIRKSIALAQAGEKEMPGSVSWELIKLTDSYLSKNTKCGSNDQECSKEIKKILQSKSFDADWGKIKEQIGS